MRTKHIKTEYETALRLYRSVSQRHVLVLEADMTENQLRHTAGIADKVRTCGNEVSSRMLKNLAQLKRTKKYKALQKAYGNLSDRLKTDPGNKDLKTRLKAITDAMVSMQQEYNVTWETARLTMAYAKNRVHVSSFFALSRAEDIWSGVEKVLYHGADTIHFKKRLDLPELRAKQTNRGIVMLVKDGQMYF